MACCHHVRTMVSGLVIHFTLNFLKEAMGAALPRQSQILLLSKPTFKCLLLPMLRRPNTFCYETCFWFILCFFFFFELLTFVLFARALEHSAQLKPHGCRSVFFFFFYWKKSNFFVQNIYFWGNGHVLPAVMAIMWEAAKIPTDMSRCVRGKSPDFIKFLPLFCSRTIKNIYHL